MYRIWASARVGQFGERFRSWVLDSAGATDSDVRLFVADVFKPFDAVDWRSLDTVLRSFLLLAWFHKCLFRIPCSC